MREPSSHATRQPGGGPPARPAADPELRDACAELLSGLCQGVVARVCDWLRLDPLGAPPDAGERAERLLTLVAGQLNNERCAAWAALLESFDELVKEVPGWNSTKLTLCLVPHPRMLEKRYAASRPLLRARPFGRDEARAGVIRAGQEPTDVPGYLWAALIAFFGEASSRSEGPFAAAPADRLFSLLAPPGPAASPRRLPGALVAALRELFLPRLDANKNVTGCLHPHFEDGLAAVLRGRKPGQAAPLDSYEKQAAPALIWIRAQLERAEAGEALGAYCQRFRELHAFAACLQTDRKNWDEKKWEAWIAPLIENLNSLAAYADCLLADPGASGPPPVRRLDADRPAPPADAQGGIAEEPHASSGTDARGAADDDQRKPEETALAALSEPPPPPRDVMAELARQFEASVGRLLNVYQRAVRARASCQDWKDAADTLGQIISRFELFRQALEVACADAGPDDARAAVDREVRSVLVLGQWFSFLVRLDRLLPGEGERAENNQELEYKGPPRAPEPARRALAEELRAARDPLYEFLNEFGGYQRHPVRVGDLASKFSEELEIKGNTRCGLDRGAVARILQPGYFVEQNGKREVKQKPWVTLAVYS
jgi:hypothetical protein